MGPIIFHPDFDLPQVQMRPPRFTENGPDAGRAGLWHLDENAFMFVRDHPAASFYIEKSRRHYKVKPCAGR